MNHTKEDRIQLEVMHERKKQEMKWGTQNHAPIEWMAVFMEEVGEVCKEIADYHFEVGKNDHDIDFEQKQADRLCNYRAELIQVQAVAQSMIACFDRNMALRGMDMTPKTIGQ